MPSHRTLPRALGAAAALALLTAAPAAAQAPAAPPQILAAPSSSTPVTEKTPVTFRIRAAAGDAQAGHWAVILSSGNTEQLELKPTKADPAVYERTVKLHNDPVFAAQPKNDDVPDFDLPTVSGRLFPDAVEWRVAFFAQGNDSPDGSAATRTPKANFSYSHTYERRDYTGKPKLPSFHTRKIVPGKSLGGIALGDRRKHVVKLWGAPFWGTDFFFDREEVWGRGAVKKGEPITRGDVASVDYDQDAAAIVAIQRPSKKPGGLGKLKTSKGIHLGSTRRAVARAYPKAEPFEAEDPDEGDLSGYTLAGKGGTITVFAMDHGKVVQIVLRAQG